MLKVISNIKNRTADLAFVGVMAINVVLRLVNLGYSDPQGDEIKALFLPDPGQSLFDFLFSQRKGPLQFLVTFLVKFLDPQYLNQFLMRLPFAIAGILAVYFFYKLVKIHFGSKIAAYAAFFMATNGFFIAFARIAQYQSMVILFAILCLYTLSLAAQDKKWATKGVLLSALFWALSILSHYDGIFIAPVVLALGLIWLKRTDLSLVHKRKAILLAALIFIALNLVFYVPFALYVTQGTKDYWLGRLTGDVSSKISSSYYLFTVYQPIYVIHFYILLFFSAVSAFLLALVPTKKLSRIAIVEPLFNVVRQVIDLPKFMWVFIWFILPFIFWEKIVYISGTHIYTYLIPVFIILAHGLVFAENLWMLLTHRLRFIKPLLIKTVVVGLFLAFVTLQSYFIYVDNTKEYPWEEEKFLFWTMNVPTPIYHLSMFGFPYFRDWENIGRFIENVEPPVGYYSTNERESISRYFIDLEKDTDKAGFYVYIRHPQSFTEEIPNAKVLYWSSKHPPIYTLSKGGTDLVNIYLMEPGTLEEIQRKGF